MQSMARAACGLLPRLPKLPPPPSLFRSLNLQRTLHLQAPSYRPKHLFASLSHPLHPLHPHLSLHPQHSQHPLHPQQRSYSSLPPLTPFPPIVHPGVAHTLRNWFLARTLITPYFDPAFSTAAFKAGALQAAVTVANSLAEGDLEQLAGLVTPDCLALLQESLGLFTQEQREALRLRIDDISLNFIYQIGILMEDHPTLAGQHTRHVEVTWVAHTVSDALEQEVEERTGGDLGKVHQALLESGGPIVLNYRFIRDFTKGVDDSWTINAVNHFRLLDLRDQE